MPRSRYIVILAGTKAEGYRYAHRAGIAARNCRIPLYAKQIEGIAVADFHILPSFTTAGHRHAILAAINRLRGAHVDLEFYYVDMPPKPVIAPVDQGDGMGEQMTIDDLLDAQRETIGTGPVMESRPTCALDDALCEAEDLARDAMDIVISTPEDILVGALDERIKDHAEQALEDGHAALESITEEDEGAETGAQEHGEDDGETEVAPKRRRSRCPDCGELRFPDEHDDCPAKSGKPSPDAAASPRDRLNDGDLW